MGKFRENISALLPLIILLAIGIPLTIQQLRKQEAEKEERKIQKESSEKIERFKLPMVKNNSSLHIGYSLQNAMIYADEAERIYYSIFLQTQDECLRVFDSLYIEICKHHCDTVILHKYKSKSRRFECSNENSSITLSNHSRMIEVEYRIPSIKRL